MCMNKHTLVPINLHEALEGETAVAAPEEPLKGQDGEEEARSPCSCEQRLLIWPSKRPRSLIVLRLMRYWSLASPHPLTVTLPPSAQGLTAVRLLPQLTLQYIYDTMLYYPFTLPPIFFSFFLFFSSLIYFSPLKDCVMQTVTCCANFSHFARLEFFSTWVKIQGLGIVI